MSKRPKSKKSAPKASPKIASLVDTERLKSLVDFMKSEGLAELEYFKGDERIRLALPQGGLSMPAGGDFVPFDMSRTANALAPAPVVNTKYKQITAPLVGTFYRSPAPGKEAYVQEGQVVKAGDALCIVEAMKLMNEIEAEYSCRIVRVLAENGQPVEYGEPLFEVEPV